MSQDANFPKIVTYAKGIVVCQEGMSDIGEMFILLKGIAGSFVNYGKPDVQQVGTLTVGSFFGEMSLFLGKNNGASLVTLSQCVFYRLSRSNVYDFFIKEPGVTFTFIKTLCSRLYANEEPSRALLYDPAKMLAELKTDLKDDYNLEEPATTEMFETPVPVEIKPDAEKAETPVPEVPKAVSRTPEEPASVKPDKSAEFAFFPEKHGVYTLPGTPPSEELLYEKSFNCPVCGKSIKVVTVKPSKLVQVKTDRDLRVRYKGVEPLYYDIITCPNCYYSTFSDLFETMSNSKTKSAVNNEIAKYKPELRLELGVSRNAETVFASYYLAMICIKICLPKPELTLGKLWLKLSRLYEDCNDTEMCDFAALKALGMYSHTYMNSEIPPRQTQQLVYILGVLSERFGDLASARKFYFQAKTDKTGSPAISRFAEDRIEEMKEAANAQQEKDE